eukprot:9876-Amphidinium_carterae.1
MVARNGYHIPPFLTSAEARTSGSRIVIASCMPTEWEPKWKLQLPARCPPHHKSGRKQASPHKNPRGSQL